MIWFLLGNRFQLTCLCLFIAGDCENCHQRNMYSDQADKIQRCQVLRKWVQFICPCRKLRLFLVLTKNSSKRCKYQFNVKLWFLFVCLEFWSYSRIFHSFLDFGIMILYPYLFDLKHTLSLFTVVRKRTDVPNFEVTGLSIMYAINIPQKVLFLLM